MSKFATKAQLESLMADMAEKISIPLVAGDIYSTEERVVGIWIDGKPLYQKTIVGVLPNVVTEGTYVLSEPYHDIEDVDTIFIIESFSEDPAPSTYRRRLPYSLNNGNQIKVSISRDQIQYVSAVKTYNGLSVYTTVQYTKTTD